MIPKRFIDEWRENAPWRTEAQIEQDLIISRALIRIFSDEFLSAKLAFRGGTAIHKLYIKNNLRYSEDIDLVQIQAEPIKPVIDKLREVLSFLGEPKIKQKANNNTMIFRFDSEIQPITPLKLKVEINCREHFSVLGFNKFLFEVKSGWFNGKTNLITYSIDELLGTKLRALFQRKKGRDFYDIYKCLNLANLNIDKILYSFEEYMKFSVHYIPSKKQFALNLQNKMNDKEFLADMTALLKPNETFDIDMAYKLINNEITERLK
jgi:predicted nucleotidyltransferase component of viral defense system